MFNVCRVKTLFSNVKRAGDATKIMQLWQKIPAKIVTSGFNWLEWSLVIAHQKAKKQRKKEKLKKRKERKRNDKWKESKAKNKKKITFCKCIRNDSEPSSRLVNRALSYGFVEKPENGFWRNLLRLKWWQNWKGTYGRSPKRQKLNRILPRQYRFEWSRLLLI